MINSVRVVYLLVIWGKRSYISCTHARKPGMRSGRLLKHGSGHFPGSQVGGRAQSVTVAGTRFDTGPSLLLFPKKYREVIQCSTVFEFFLPCGPYPQKPDVAALGICFRFTDCEGDYDVHPMALLP